ncbi:MAG: hypothetical protein COV34_01125 [Candidatus Zambryskibacteria bacterium CG10_big_fil_rev_8_21_14_0_10_42_12]|uniref:Uncharacterized protein n=1 Tax=Candidatus Zambryskibacteria bacterium CG10_big_fil_rev_8_21_14_0_10_42_12 TaxID=1975115 RepID=A0A2H0QV94_9BACT|nr:MAG: hypothetical protein COV34_01125 [Candidatus Zambryskibacteria bacterium CG10_big_fil_rev_8_21_14_0_10_42_12]
MDRKVQELLSLTRENNTMLHKMRRSQRIANIMRVVYWLILAGAAIGAYYFIQPYIEGAQQFYNDVDARFTAVDEEFQGNLQNFLDFFKSEE